MKEGCIRLFHNRKVLGYIHDIAITPKIEKIEGAINVLAVRCKYRDIKLKLVTTDIQRNTIENLTRKSKPVKFTISGPKIKQSIKKWPILGNIVEVEKEFGLSGEFYKITIRESIDKYLGFKL